MAFVIKLQTNNSENICVTKNITDIEDKTGVLREATSIIDPIFVVKGSVSDFVGCNYCTIEDFGRSYFIRDITTLSNGLVELNCHVDVLSSFATEIRENIGVVKRQENNTSYNLYINDNSLVAYQDPYILTEPFPSGFTGSEFILAIAGA